MHLRRRGASSNRELDQRWAIALGFSIGLGADRAEGQAEIRNLTQPIPVVNSGGHSAPVRSPIRSPDGGNSLSRGSTRS